MKGAAKAGVIAIGAIILLLLGLAGSISVGWTDMGLGSAVSALFDSSGSKEHIIVTTLRLPRALLAAIIGASLAVAGAIMQAMTGNPLASPQTFGVNAGASMAVVASLVLLPNLPMPYFALMAFGGAILGGFAVFSMGSAGGMTPVKLALAGTAVHLFLSSITEAFILFHQHSTDQVLFWLAGSLDGADWTDIQRVFPWAVAGLLLSFLMSRSISVMKMGEDVARNLGQNVMRVRLVCGVIVIVLAGSGVAVAGPIGFVGLMVPHLVRYAVGAQTRMYLPLTALAGAVLLVVADILCRFIAYPYESPVGIVTALLGAPFFLYLVSKERRGA
ncbi:iron ABC transporter permease [Brevibacillus nitrificans]|uniref:Iron ABC transporter permease n=1 Tax=Brevibacillus nitrificans TaxID=651560 RepID=A0A3M8DBG1_9BACL|nr:iron ABC transporter permease [Brevibacillus nitrificans]RNB85303.1 iron ABC transporter permease [Brevibacillus nitrificans]